MRGLFNTYLIHIFYRNIKIQMVEDIFARQ